MQNNTALLVVLAISILVPARCVAAGFVEEPLRWGVQGGIHVALDPVSVDEDPCGDPPGLLRVGMPVREGGAYELMNYIAVEPTVNGKLDQSELLKLPFTAEAPVRTTVDNVAAMEVTVRPAPFPNGAHVRLVMQFREDRPGEVRFKIHQEEGSAPIQRCLLTATMGNRARVREVHLARGVITSHQVFGSYRGPDFAPTEDIHPASELQKTEAGDWIVRFTGDEPDPAATVPFGLPNWHYRGARVMQYWKKPANTPAVNLELRTNARFMYWMTDVQIPGGISFENIDLRDDFVDGEEFVYGVER